MSEEIQNQETEATPDTGQMATPKAPTIQRMVEFEFTTITGNMYKGIPNIILYDAQKIAQHTDWQQANVEIRMNPQLTPDFIRAVGKAILNNEEVHGMLLIKHLRNTEYYLIPTGTSDFILAATEIAKGMGFTVLE